MVLKKLLGLNILLTKRIIPGIKSSFPVSLSLVFPQIFYHGVGSIIYRVYVVS